MEEQSEKYLFEEMPVPKAVATLAIPTIISQVVTMIYNLADTFFIGQIGDPYMVAAVSLVSPWFNLLTALGNLFGLGGSSLISRLLCRRLCRFRAADPASVHPGGADQYAGRAVPSDCLPCRAADLREFPHQLYAAGHGKGRPVRRSYLQQAGASEHPAADPHESDHRPVRHDLDPAGGGGYHAACFVGDVPLHLPAPASGGGQGEPVREPGL